MGFQHGLSGLRGASAKLDVTGNNIANANTVGFKQSQAQFSDVFANALGGGRNQIGIGTQLAAVAQEFTQGNVTPTNNPLDVAITGNGFFRMSNNGTVSYTRNGQFHLDKDGFLVNASNYNVTGFSADASGHIIPNIPVNLRLPTADMTPKPTTSFMAGVNLDARVDLTTQTTTPATSPTTPPTIPTFSATDPKTYAHSTSGEIFDSFGNSHLMTLYFQRTNPAAPAASAWNVFATVEGATSASGVPFLSPLNLTFDQSGIMDASVAPVNVNVTFDDPTIQPLAFSLDLTRSTQFGSKFGVNAMNQDGFASGRLAGYSISDNGEIRASYTNNVTRTVGQLALAGFSNPNGLKSMGNNQWGETAESGLPLVGIPQTGILGSLQSSAVEESNVDLTTELVSLIMTQRVYQANAKTIETQDAVMQTVMNI